MKESSSAPVQSIVPSAPPLETIEVHEENPCVICMEAKVRNCKNVYCGMVWYGTFKLDFQFFLA